MALNCRISKAVEPKCGTVLSGIQLMAIANWNEDKTATSSGSDCMIDTIDLGTEKFYPINIAEGTGSAECQLSAGANKDAKALNHVVNGIFNTIDCDLIGDYKNYLLGTVIIAFQMKDRSVWIAGWDNGLTSTTFNFATGAAEGDQSGLTFAYEGIQPDMFLRVKDWATIKALMA